MHHPYADLRRRPYEGLARWAIRCFSIKHTAAFNAITEGVCRWLGHSYVHDAWGVELAVTQQRQVTSTMQHFCPVCCTMGPKVPAADIAAWRRRHGVRNVERRGSRAVELLGRLLYAIRTATGAMPNENGRERIYKVFPF